MVLACACLEYVVRLMNYVELQHCIILLGFKAPACDGNCCKNKLVTSSITDAIRVWKAHLWARQPETTCKKLQKWIHTEWALLQTSMHTNHMTSNKKLLVTKTWHSRPCRKCLSIACRDNNFAGSLVFWYWMGIGCGAFWTWERTATNSHGKDGSQGIDVAEEDTIDVLRELIATRWSEKIFARNVCVPLLLQSDTKHGWKKVSNTWSPYHAAECGLDTQVLSPDGEVRPGTSRIDAAEVSATQMKLEILQYSRRVHPNMQ